MAARPGDPCMAPRLMTGQLHLCHAWESIASRISFCPSYLLQVRVSYGLRSSDWRWRRRAQRGAAASFRGSARCGLMSHSTVPRTSLGGRTCKGPTDGRPASATQIVSKRALQCRSPGRRSQRCTPFSLGRNCQPSRFKAKRQPAEINSGCITRHLTTSTNRTDC
jgi:hypothetical protein